MYVNILINIENIQLF